MSGVSGLLSLSATLVVTRCLTLVRTSTVELQMLKSDLMLEATHLLNLICLSSFRETGQKEKG